MKLQADNNLSYQSLKKPLADLVESTRLSTLNISRQSQIQLDLTAAVDRALNGQQEEEVMTANDWDAMDGYDENDEQEEEEDEVDFEDIHDDDDIKHETDDAMDIDGNGPELESYCAMTSTTTSTSTSSTTGTSSSASASASSTSASSSKGKTRIENKITDDMEEKIQKLIKEEKAQWEFPYTLDMIDKKIKIEMPPEEFLRTLKKAYGEWQTTGKVQSHWKVPKCCPFHRQSKTNGQQPCIFPTKQQSDKKAVRLEGMFRHWFETQVHFKGNVTFGTLLCPYCDKKQSTNYIIKHLKKCRTIRKMQKSAK